MTGHRPLGRQPQSEGEPVFDAPWQARAFAMAVHLNEQGAFNWKEWSDRLANCIESHEQHQAIRDSNDYYRVWLSALETIIDDMDEPSPAPAKRVEKT